MIDAPLWLACAAVVAKPERSEWPETSLGEL
jgi:hypothetical protein